MAGRPGTGSILARARVVRAYDHAGATTILGEAGELRRFEGDSADLACAILEATVTPQRREELCALLSEHAGRPVAWAGPVAETVAHLEAAGALHAGEAPTPPAGPGRRVVLGLAGGVAAAFAPGLVQILLARGHEVRVAATRSALRFAPPLAIEALTHAPVVASLWPRDPREPVPHLALARWAEIVVVYPATATSIARLAAGSCDTVVSAAAIATRAPVLVVPSMNDAMWASPSVQRNLDQLREDGFYVAHPACGVEVADAPRRRTPMIGAAPPLLAVADLVGAILDHECPRSEGPSAASWDALYRDERLEDLPWFMGTLDADLDAVLAGIERGGGLLLDLGTGPGTAAIAACDRGFSVVAADVSPRAVEIARQRGGARPIVWLVDDVRASAIRGAFDVVLDRGLGHVLTEDELARHARFLAERVRPGGSLVLKWHAPGAAEDLGTRRFAREDVRALFGGDFDLARADDAVLPGAGGSAAPALLCVLRRR